MKILLHTCCAPCLLFPYSVLKSKKFEVTVYFYNPNIHPFKEFKRRRETLSKYCDTVSLDLILDDGGYGLIDFCRKVAFQEEKRCSICYDMRLQKLVATAKNEGFDAFSTTLLYSKYQKHELLRNKCNELAQYHGIPFVYHDFREGWQQGIDQSIELNLYRQPYCGCIFSEWERYDNRLKKKLKKP